MANDTMTSSLRQHYYTPPTPPVQVTVLPEKMEIRVVEYEKDGRIVKTYLEYRMHHYDQNGVLVNTTQWEVVDRIRINMDEAV